MFKKYAKRMLGIVLPIFLLVFAGISMASTHTAKDPIGSNKRFSNLADQVRHELVMLPYFGVFDNLGFALEDANTVVLSGQVVRPLLKSEAETAVKRIPNVSKVVNNIEILPISPSDDTIRVRTYRAIYSKSGFEKYAIQADPPIRIIVKNGSITLEGAVGNRIDKTMAYMAARSVPNAFSVTDNLMIN
jgi:hyperosmotically inducible protein